MRKSFKILLISILAVILVCTLFACGKDTDRPYPVNPQPPQEEAGPDGTLVDGTPIFNPGKPVYLSPVYIRKELSPSSKDKGAILPMQYKDVPGVVAFDYSMISFQVIGKVGENSFSPIKFKTTKDGTAVDSLKLAELKNIGSIVIAPQPFGNSGSLPELNNSGETILEFKANSLFVENSKHEFVEKKDLTGRVKVYLGQYYNEVKKTVKFNLKDFKNDNDSIIIDKNDVGTADLMVGDVISFSKFVSTFKVSQKIADNTQALDYWVVKVTTKDGVVVYSFSGSKNPEDPHSITSLEIKQDSEYEFTPVFANNVVEIKFEIPIKPDDVKKMTASSTTIKGTGIVSIPEENDNFKIEQTGYEFVGWFYEEEGVETKWNFNTPIGNRKDLTLKAKYEEKTFSLTIYLRGSKFDIKPKYANKTMVSAYPSFQKQNPYGMNILKIDGLKKGMPYNSYQFNTWLNCEEKSQTDSTNSSAVKPELVLIPGYVQLGELASFMKKPEDIGRGSNGFYEPAKFYVEGQDGFFDLSKAEVQGDLVLYTSWTLKPNLTPDKQEAYDNKTLFNNAEYFTIKADGTVRLDKIENYYVEELHIPATYNVKNKDGSTTKYPITEIGAYMCQNFTGLKKLDLSDAIYLETIGERAFANCTKLTKEGIVTEKTGNATTTAETKTNSLNIKTIGREAFEGTPFIKEDGAVSIGSVLIAYNKLPNISALNNLKGIDTIAAGCFENKGLQGKLVLTGIKRIYEKAFAKNGITSVEINGTEYRNTPMVLEYVASNAFENTDFIATVSNQDVLFEGRKYLYLGKNIVNYTIPNTVEIIGEEAFLMKTDIENLLEGTAVREVYRDAFKGTKFVEQNNTQKANLTTYSANGFVVVNNILCNYTGKETSVQIPNRITAIAPYAFSGYNNKDVTDIVITPTVQKIGDYAFKDALKKVNGRRGDARIYFQRKQFLGGESPSKVIDIKPTAFTNNKGEIFENLKFFFSIDEKKDVNEADSFGDGYLKTLYTLNPGRFKYFKLNKVEFNNDVIENEFLLGLNQGDQTIVDELNKTDETQFEQFLTFVKKNILKGKKPFEELPNEIFNGILQSYIEVIDTATLDNNNIVQVKTGLILEAPNAGEGQSAFELSFKKAGTMLNQDALPTDSLVYKLHNNTCILPITINYTIDGVVTKTGVTTIKVNNSDAVLFNDGKHQDFTGGPFRYNKNDENSYLFEKTKIKVDEAHKDQSLKIKFNKFGGGEIIVDLFDIKDNLNKYVVAFKSDIVGGQTKQKFIFEYPVSRDVTYRFEYDYIIEEVEYTEIKQISKIPQTVEIGINKSIFDAASYFKLVKNNGDEKDHLHFDSKNVRIVSIDGYDVQDFNNPMLPVLGGGHVVAKYNIAGKSLDFEFDFKVYMSSEQSDFKFEIRDSNTPGAKEAYITGFRKFTNETMMIPSSYKDGSGNEFPVVGIDLKIKDTNNIIIEIGMPSSIRYIGNGSFEGWKKLQRIGYYTSKENNVFTKKLYKEDFDKGIKAKNEFPLDLEKIDDSAFANTALRDIVLNSHVVIIGVNAFGNTPVVNVNMERCLNLGYIGTQAFYNCNELQTVALPKLNQIPDPEKIISVNAFYNCDKLYKVSNLEYWTLGKGAFNTCPALIPIGSKPDGSVPDGFVNCSPLDSDLIIENNIVKGFKNELSTNREFLTIPNNVTEIADGAFRNNKKLRFVVLPSSLTKIGANAFSGCTSLTTIDIPVNVTTIGANAFSGCTSLTTIDIPVNVTTIDASAFSGCTGLKTITIPANVTTIGANAFSGCTGLTTITIPASVTTIGACAFSGCTGLTTVKILANITAIADNMFDGCTNLTTVSIPETVTIIGANAFSGCTSLTTIDIPVNVTTIGASAFSGCTGLKTITIPANVTTIGASAFSGCTGLKTITIPANVTTIGANAFSGCTGLTTITIPASVTTIGAGAFSGCTGLTTVKIPASVTTIGANAFSGCTGLTTITIPASVTTIGASAFSGCTSLTAIDIPTTVTTIGASAFNGCTALKNITITTTTEIGLDVFANCPSITTAKLLKGTQKTQFMIPEFITEIGASAFSGWTGLTTITIPESVTTIGASAFNGCTTLATVTISTTTRTIGADAFANCAKDLTVTLVKGDVTGTYTVPAFVTKIDATTFDENNFEALLVENGNKTYNAKGNCIIETATNKLVLGCKTSVIPLNVTTIGANAFKGCATDSTIVIPESVTEIGNNAFSGLTNVYYKGNSTAWDSINKGTIIGTIVYYYSEMEPNKTQDQTAYDGYYWHYVDSVVTIWVVK